MLAKAELYVQRAQRIGVITKIIQALFLVAEGDICPQREVYKRQLLIYKKITPRNTF